MSKQIDSFSTWLSGLEKSIEEKGFLRAWKEHILEIAQAHDWSDPAESMWGANLFRLMNKDPDFKEHFDSLPPEQAKQLRSLLDGGAPDRPTATARRRDSIDDTRSRILELAEDSPDVMEADGSAMKCLNKETFQNWGRTVKNVPSVTYLPTTKAGVCNIVRQASATDKAVRVSGYRHTWGDLYSNDGEVLISLLPLDVVNDLPAQEPPIDPDNELQGIEIVGQVNEGGATKALCKIGAATTNEQFRRWCIRRWQANQPGWTVPLNVIMVEITWGGSNASICHGAGWRNKTLSDLVAEIEFVNVKGELQVVNDPEQLKAAAGCFGLLGVVTSVTLKLDAMTFANLKPKKQRVGLAVPPPAGFQVPSGVDMSGITPEELEKATAEFVERCENDFYAEWFWFTFQSDCWINTWKNDGNPEQAVDYPGEIETKIQEAEEYLAGLIVESTLYNLLPEKWQAEMLGGPAMLFLPSDETIATPLIDGLHFRRGIQNMRVLDTEWEIPIPPRADDPTKPDWSICQRAWWDAVALVYVLYESTKKVPMRLTLEMRVMADSNITMAPQYGNSFGTCAIEVLTTLNTDAGDWKEFMQAVADKWNSYSDPAGNPLKARPHWAKQWQGLMVRGLPVAEFLTSVAYKDQLPEFKGGLQAIAAAGGYTTADLKPRFSNPLLNNIFGSVFV